jgi:ribose transport system permease protein
VTAVTARTRAVAHPEWAGLLVAVVVAGAVLAALYPNFTSNFNAYVLLRAFAVAAIVGFAQMITLAIGEMNLSVGALGGMISVGLGLMLERWGVPIAVAVVVALLAGLAGGLITGGLIAATGISGFVITLALASAFAGVSLGVTESKPFYNLPPALVDFGRGRIFGVVPYVALVAVAVGAALVLLLARAPLGRRLLAMGGNRHAAELSGISVRACVIWAYVLAGGLVALATVIAVAQLGSAQPTVGADWVLASFAAPIIGGAALQGGSVSVTGTALAAMLIALIQNGLVLAEADPFWVQLLLGLLILIGVGMGRLRFARRAPRQEATA